MTDQPNLGKALLVNLARRCRWAKRDLRRAVVRGWTSEIERLRGAENEAWNSFQAAKAIWQERKDRQV